MFIGKRNSWMKYFSEPFGFMYLLILLLFGALLARISAKDFVPLDILIAFSFILPFLLKIVSKSKFFSIDARGVRWKAYLRALMYIIFMCGMFWLASGHFFIGFIGVPLGLMAFAFKIIEPRVPTSLRLILAALMFGLYMAIWFLIYDRTALVDPISHQPMDHRNFWAAMIGAFSIAIFSVGFAIACIPPIRRLLERMPGSKDISDKSREGVSAINEMGQVFSATAILLSVLGAVFASITFLPAGRPFIAIWLLSISCLSFCLMVASFKLVGKSTKVLLAISLLLLIYVIRYAFIVLLHRNYF